MILVCTIDETVKYNLVGRRSAIVENFSTGITIGLYRYIATIYIKALRSRPILLELRSVYWKITDYKNTRRKTFHIFPVVKIISSK